MGFRGGASEALIGACVKSDPEVDRYEIAPPVLSVTSCFGGGKVPGRWRQAKAQAVPVWLSPIVMRRRRLSAAVRWCSQ